MAIHEPFAVSATSSSGGWRLITGLGTLASRVLGLVRDIATGALLGMAGGGVMDAFVIANRIPNLFRELFGEGALTACYLPVVAGHLETDRRRAWQLTSVLLVWLTALLCGLVLLGEAILAGIWLLSGGDARLHLLLGLTATLLPYMLLICLAAQLTATLQALAHFTTPALSPTLLNICWLTGVWAIAPWFAPDRQAQAYVLAVSILVAGVLQVGVQLPMLYRLGFRFDYEWAASRDGMLRIGRTITPMLFGLAVTQINTFTDSMMAWGLAAAPGGPHAHSPGLAGPWPTRCGKGPPPPFISANACINFHWASWDWPWPPRFSRCSAGTPRTERPRPARRRSDAGAAAGAVSERAGGRRLDRAGPSVGQTALPARQFHLGGCRSGCPHDRRLLARRLGLLRLDGYGARVLCPGRHRDAGQNRRGDGLAQLGA